MERLEDAHMEHVVNARTLRELKAVGDITHAFLHLVRPRVMGTQLVAATRQQGLSWAMEQPEPHPVPDVEAQVAMMSVVVALGIVLCLLETFPDIGDESVAVLEQRVHHRSLRGGGRVLKVRWS